MHAVFTIQQQYYNLQFTIQQYLITYNIQNIIEYNKKYLLMQISKQQRQGDKQMPSQQVANENIVGHFFRCLMNGQIDIIIDETLQHVWASFKIVVGNLLVRGYRLFKYMIDQQCLIFIKRQQYGSKYLYLKMALRSTDDLAPNLFTSLYHCISQLNKMRKKQNQQYIVLILFALHYSTIQVNCCRQLEQILVSNHSYSYIQLINALGQQNFTCQNFIIPYTSNDQIIIGESQDEQKKLKQILYSYVDTFGQKLKTSYYKDLTKKSLYLINTLNMIVFEETKPLRKPGQHTPCYNQIQSACWTAFKTGKLESDRKDIVFSGNGCILFVDIIFSRSLNLYIDQMYELEVQQLVNECQKAYNQTKVKVIRIENSMTVRNVYCFQSKLVHKYTKS